MKAKITREPPKSVKELKPTDYRFQKQQAVFVDDKLSDVMEELSTPPPLLILAIRCFTKYALEEQNDKDLLTTLFKQLGYDHLIPILHKFIHLEHPLENGIALPSYACPPISSFLQSPTIVVKPASLSNDKWVPSIQIICEKCSSSMFVELSSYGANGNWAKNEGQHVDYSYFYAYCPNCKEKERPLVALITSSQDLRLIEMEARKERLKKEDADLVVQIAARRKREY